MQKRSPRLLPPPRRCDDQHDQQRIRSFQRRSSANLCHGDGNDSVYARGSGTSAHASWPPAAAGRNTQGIGEESCKKVDVAKLGNFQSSGRARDRSWVRRTQLRLNVLGIECPSGYRVPGRTLPRVAEPMGSCGLFCVVNVPAVFESAQERSCVGVVLPLTHRVW